MMKRLALLAAILPGMASAHGLHAPAADHTAAHAGPAFGALVIAAALYVALRSRRARG
jgi:hypothetical protein